MPRRPDALFDPDAEVERREYHGSMPYWAWVWDAAEPCVEGLLRHAVKGRVLELGAGLGAVGLAWAAATEEEASLTISDYDPRAVAAMGVNADLNGLAGVDVWNLDWTDLSASPAQEPAEPFDAVIGCEVLYDPTRHGALLDAIERYVKPSSGRALIFDPGRAPAKQFARRAEKRGFSVDVQSPAGEPAACAQGEPRWLILEPR